MKIRFFIFFIFWELFLVNTFSQIEIDVFQDQMQEFVKVNNVKSKTVWNHSFEKGRPDEKGYRNTHLSFDKEGKLIEEVKYNSNHEAFLIETYQYNHQNLNTGYVRIDGNDNKVIFRRTYRYDKDGNRLLEMGFDGVVNYRNQYIYENDRLSAIFYYTENSSKGNHHQKRIFEYGNDNTHRTVYVYDGDENLLFRLEQRFDPNGNLIEDAEYDRNDKQIVKKFQYAYNANGQILEEVYHEYGQLKYKKKFVYSTGLLRKITQQDASGNIFDLRRYTYDNTGRLIKELYRRRSNQEFSVRQYTYDDRGICVEEESYYASYDYRVLFKYKYEFY